MTDTALAQMGDNRPPADADPLRERLQSDHKALCVRVDELIAAVERVPEEISERTAGKVGDFIKQLSGHRKSLDAARVDEKEPYLAGGRNVDGFFKPMMDGLDKAKKVVEGRLNVFLRLKAEEERRRREEEARRQAEEEARLKAEAEAKIAKVTDEAEMEGAIAAEEAARQAEADRLKAQREAEAKAAELSRSRGDYGSVASLRTFWDFQITDLDAIPLDLIRAHIPRNAVEQAIRSYVKAGGRELEGVRIFENTSTVVR